MWRRMLPYQNPWRLVTTGGVVYVTGWSPDGWVLAIDARTGRQLWEFLSVAAPVVAAAEGIAYICGASAEVRTCDVRSGLPGWTREFSTAVTAGPAVASGLAYVGLETGEVHALDMASGDELWSYPLGAQVTSLTAAGGIAYAIAADCAIYALPAAP
jgi:outer membrane protein assembly factor BamB